MDAAKTNVSPEMTRFNTALQQALKEGSSSQASLPFLLLWKVPLKELRIVAESKPVEWNSQQLSAVRCFSSRDMRPIVLGRTS